MREEPDLSEQAEGKGREIVRKRRCRKSARRGNGRAVDSATAG